jgi:hypothetical protein
LAEHLGEEFTEYPPIALVGMRDYTYVSEDYTPAIGCYFISGGAAEDTA